MRSAAGVERRVMCWDTEYYVLVNGSPAYYISRDNVKVSKQPQGENSVDGTVLGYLIEKKKD